MLAIGPNAIRVLKQIGIWDAVMKKCTPADLGLQGFIYYNGIGEHKAAYEVLDLQLPNDRRSLITIHDLAVPRGSS